MIHVKSSARSATGGPIEFGPQHRTGNGESYGLGWLRDLPDLRDATLHDLAPKFESSAPHRRVHSAVQEAIVGANIPSSVDNSAFCSPIEYQGQLGACTAHAGVGMVEYMERVASGRYVAASRLFLYKVSRKLLGWTGDTGAYLRTTMQALALFGVPPESFWPYDVTKFDNDPDAFLYSYASNYQALQYLRLDPPNTPATEVLQNAKAAIAKKYAVIFGITVYTSLDAGPDIPYPAKTDSANGGHALLMIGYDDARPNRGTANKGAFKVRNSWGTAWGDKGYGYLPYDYLLNGLAADLWTCTKQEWVDSNQFN